MKKYIFLLAFFVASIAIAKIHADDTDDFVTFWTEYKGWLKKGNVEEIANHTRFPFNGIDFKSRVFGKEYEEKELTREVFMKKFKKILSPSDVKTLMKSAPKKTDLYGEDGLTYTVVYQRTSKSASWLVFYKDEGKWLLVNTDNVSE